MSLILSANSGTGKQVDGVNTPNWLIEHQTSQPPASPTPADSPVSAAHLLRTSLGLVLVLALIFILGWIFKRLGPFRMQSGRLINIVAQQSLGRHQRLVIVEVDGEYLALGVTQQSINYLYTLKHPPKANGNTSLKRPTNSEFSQKLKRSIERVLTKKSS